MVKCPTSAWVMISRFASSSPVWGSALTARSLEPASDSVFPSLCPSPACALSLSLKNKYMLKKIFFFRKKKSTGNEPSKESSKSHLRKVAVPSLCQAVRLHWSRARDSARQQHRLGRLPPWLCPQRLPKKLPILLLALVATNVPAAGPGHSGSSDMSCKIPSKTGASKCCGYAFGRPPLSALCPSPPQTQGQIQPAAKKPKKEA